MGAPAARRAAAARAGAAALAAGGHLDAPLLAQVAELIRFDLNFTLRHWREPSYDIWEEESGHHYYTLRVSAAALAEGAAWFQGAGDTAQASAASSSRRPC
jgi:glucoamylase